MMVGITSGAVREGSRDCWRMSVGRTVRVVGERLAGRCLGYPAAPRSGLFGWLRVDAGGVALTKVGIRPHLWMVGHRWRRDPGNCAELPAGRYGLRCTGAVSGARPRSAGPSLAIVWSITRGCWSRHPDGGQDPLSLRWSSAMIGPTTDSGIRWNDGGRLVGTGAQSVSRQTVKLSPQPQAPLALGLAKTKPAVKSSSTQSIVEPMR
jgi:hypothetical protein